MLWVMVVALLVAGLWSLWLEPLLKQRTRTGRPNSHGCRRSSALAPLLHARERQQLAQGQHPTLAGLRDQIKAAGLAGATYRSARRCCTCRRAVPADALWNWLLPLLADPAIELQQLQ